MTKRDPEREYLDHIEAIIEHFGSIQRQFVFDKSGVHAIVKFIEGFSGELPAFSLDDPVMVKAKHAAGQVVEELDAALTDLRRLSPPEQWKPFHDAFVMSLNLQLTGYQAMSRIFEDRDVVHLSEGQALVDRGMSILEAGQRRPAVP